ncbi:MAG: nitrilase-related carbon-nitrogen hydrolase [Rhodanobacter sp.]
MALQRERSMVMVALLATLLSAAGWWFGAQLHPVWWAAWLAPLPILWLATRVRARWVILAALVASMIGSLQQWHYIHDMLHLPLQALVPQFFGPALAFMLCALLYRRLVLRGRPLAAALAVPVLWTAIFFINGTLSHDGTWSDLAYSQMDALAVIQIAAVTGLWGVGFIVMLAPATVAVLCERTANARSRWQVVLVGGGLVVAALLYGGWRLHSADREPNTPVNIGLLALQGPIHPSLDTPKGQDFLKRYVIALDTLASKGVQMVVMPEVTLTVSDPDIAELAQVAQQHGIVLVTSVDYKPNVAGSATGAERNMSIAFHPQGGRPDTYFKHHLMSVVEDRFTPGDSYTVLDTTPRVGLVICKDMDFPAMGPANVAHGAQLLLVPAWDFYVDGWYHSRMAIMRGVESGLAIARAARDGYLTLSDDRGRIIAQIPSNQDIDVSLTGTLPVRQTSTLYTRWGNWFGWLDLLVLLGLLTLAWLPRQSALTR